MQWYDIFEVMKIPQFCNFLTNDKRKMLYDNLDTIFKKISTNELEINLQNSQFSTKEEIEKTILSTMENLKNAKYKPILIMLLRNIPQLKKLNNINTDKSPFVKTGISDIDIFVSNFENALKELI